jgi:sugar phosphate isomerase/epimerase
MAYPLRIGIRAHDFGKLPADELARRIAAKGLSSVQLALNKAIDGLDLKPGDLTPGLAHHVGSAFAANGLQIAVLGCYINLSHPDPAAKAPLLAYFKNHLRYASAFGAAAGNIVGTETGSLNPDWSPHPGNPTEEAYKALVPVVAELVAEAEHCGAIFGIEGVASHVLNSPQRIRRLLDDIKSSALQVIFDPVNLLAWDNYTEQDTIIHESFNLFGDRIAIIHAKDFAPDPATKKLLQLRTGAGKNGATESTGLNYPLLMKYLTQSKPGIAILLEEASEPTAEECIRFIHAAAA